MSEANDTDRNVTEPDTTQEQHPTAEAAPGEEQTGAELVKFGILAVVLIFTVLIIAALRPVIFGRIVPAVLGEGQPVAPLVNSATEAETIKPETEEEETEGAGDTEGEMAGEDEAEGEDTAVTNESTPPEPENPEDFPTAVPAQTHTVQAGENLTAIARRYGVTVQAIVAANSIPNPDRVTIGTVLIIPEGQ